MGRHLKTNPKTRFIIDDPEEIEKAKQYYIELGIGRAAMKMEVSYEAMREFGQRHKLKTKFNNATFRKIWDKEEIEWLKKEIVGLTFDDSEKNYRILAEKINEKFGTNRTPMAVKSKLGALRLLVPQTYEIEEPFYTIEERDAAFADRDKEENERVAGAELTLKEYFDSLSNKIEERCKPYEDKVYHTEEFSIP